MPTETKTEKTAESASIEVCHWCGKTMEEHLESRPKDAPVPRMPCTLLKSGFLAKQKPKEFTPRRLRVITNSARGKYLVDADTGEDLRLPVISMTVEPFGQQANVHCTFVVVGVEREAK